MQTSFSQRFPHLSEIITTPIAELPTPVSQLEELSQHAFIKSDNLTHSQYGGNKIRKLDWTGADVQSKNARHVVTFGAIGTNAGVATAMMCQRLGVRCTIYLFDQPLSETVNANLKRMQGYGAELIYCGSLLHTIIRFYTSPLRLLPGSYFLWAGCSNPPAILAYVDAVFELQQQIAGGELPEPDKIVVPVGSGSTAAGLYLGLTLTGLGSELIPVRVAPLKLGPFDACTDSIINKMIRQGAQQLGINTPLPQSKLNHAYYGEGYGHSNEQVKAAIDKFKQSGITLEGTYSGKAACAFLDNLQSSTGPVLFWNTYNSSQYIPTPALSHLPASLTKRLQKGDSQQGQVNGS